MVALAEWIQPEKTDIEPETRVGNFFGRDREGVGESEPQVVDRVWIIELRIYDSRRSPSLARSVDNIIWKGSSENIAKAKGLWNKALEARMPDGSLPQGVKDMLALAENGTGYRVVIYALPGNGGSTYEPDDLLGAMTPEVKKDWLLDLFRDPQPAGSGGVMRFYPGAFGKFKDGVMEDPMSTLVHESAHAYAALKGRMKSMHMYEEVRAANIENEFRYANGIEQRKRLYRTLHPRAKPQEYPLKQFP